MQVIYTVPLRVISLFSSLKAPNTQYSYIVGGQSTFVDILNFQEPNKMAKNETSEKATLW